jgi:putative Ca2+/H+ antiporter (TMEM165/GDT1 family)
VNLALAAAVFPVIFLGELPDETMFASLVMATRGRPFAVWIGATAAFAVRAVIAITVGVLLIDILPHRAVEVAAALTFFAGAGFALYDGLRGGGRPGAGGYSAGRHAAAGIAVGGGQGLLRFVSVSVIRVTTGVVLIILGCCAAWAALG